LRHGTAKKGRGQENRLKSVEKSRIDVKGILQARHGGSYDLGR